MNALVSLPDGRTLCLAGVATGADVLAGVRAAEGISESAQRLFVGLRLLRAGDALCPLGGDGLVLVRVSLGLLGGKGGFGSLLRASGTRVGQKATTNFSAMRDLSGRRMRHVDAERELKEWLESGEKVQQGPEVHEEFRNIRDNRYVEKRPCKFGKDCKYQYKCRFTHPVDEEVKKQERLVNLSNFFGDPDNPVPEPVQPDAIASAVEAGLRRERERQKQKREEALRKRKAEEVAEGEGGPGAAAPAAAPKALPPVPEFFDPDLVAADLAVHARGGGGSAEGPAAAADPAPMEDARAPAAAAAAAAASVAAVGPKAAGDAVVDRPPSPKRARHAPAAAAAAGPAAGAGEPAPAAAAAPAGAAAAPADAGRAAPSAAPPPPPLDLAAFASADALAAAVDGERLKVELQRVGLKCGGTVAERAARLFLLKTTPLAQIPKKFLAAPHQK